MNWNDVFREDTGEFTCPSPLTCVISLNAKGSPRAAECQKRFKSTGVYKQPRVKMSEIER